MAAAFGVASGAPAAERPQPAVMTKPSGPLEPGWEVEVRAVSMKPAQPPPPSFFGVAPIEVPTSAEVATMHRAGVATVRVPVTWRGVQAAPGAPFEWTALDEWFVRLAEHRMRPLPVLVADAKFVPDLTAGASPQTLSQWAAFVRAVVGRYRPGGRFWDELAHESARVARPPRVWEVWNEQNGVHSWPPAPSPEEYRKLLRVSARAIRRLDHDAEIMLGGMFGSPPREGGIEAGEFLARLYEMPGARKDFDIVGIHPYAGGLGGITKQIRAIRRVMVEAGDRRSDTWVTELGWSSVPDPRSDFAAYSRTPEGQAAMLERAGKFLIGARERWNIRGMIWFAWRDPHPGLSLCPFCSAAGLLSYDTTPKLSLGAFGDLAARARR